MSFPSSLPPALVAALLLALGIGPPLGALTPVDEPFRLDHGSTCRESDADLARLADGGFVAVWLQGVEPDIELFAPLRVFARLFQPDGTPRGLPFVVDSEPPGEGLVPVTNPVVAASPSGGFVVAWVRRTPSSESPVPETRVLARLFNTAGVPLAPTLDLAPTHHSGQVDADAEGAGYRLAWVARGPRLDTVDTLSIDASGVPTAPRTVLGFDAPGAVEVRLDSPRIASDPLGFSVVATVHEVVDGVPSAPTLTGRRYDGASLDTVPIPLFGGPADPFRRAPAVGTDDAGNTLVVWRREQAAGVRGLGATVFAADGSTLLPAHWLTGPGGWLALSDPALTLDGDGSFRVAWTGERSGSGRIGLYVVSFDSRGRATSAERAFRTTVRDSAPPIEDLRHPDLFRLGVDELLAAWHEVLPIEGIPEAPLCNTTGIRAQRLDTAPQRALGLHDGRFAVSVSWTDPYSLPEKAGIGTAVPLGDESGWFWFFRPGNAELVVKVLDGRFTNGHWWVFHGGLSTVGYTLAVTDTASGQTRAYDKPPFERLSAADTRAFPAGEGTGPPPPAALRGAGADTAPDSAAGPCTDPSLPVVRRPGLCLQERFEVEVELEDLFFNLNQRAAPLSSDTGRLWFFRQDNTELLVKVLDGRPVNGRWWVFSGALTNVGYTLVVRDTASGEERRYEVPQGRFESIADATAF